MELKQMEYLVAAVESKSLNKAAERLYTSQPNVSKILSKLEKDLGVLVLERTAKGVYLTSFGERVYDYAKHIIKTAQVIEEMAINESYEELKIASYPSNMITHKLAHYYNDNEDKSLHIEFLSGTIEEVIDYVQTFSANLGIVYYPCHQEHAFKQILKRKHLEFHGLKKCNVSLYVGPKHPLYGKKSITFDVLENLKFVQVKRDFFSVIEHLHVISKGKVGVTHMKHVVHTNSDHAMMNMLKLTDLCTLGLDLIDIKYKDSMIQRVHIEGAEKSLSIGYITRSKHSLSKNEVSFIRQVEKLMM